MVCNSPCHLLVLMYTPWESMSIADRAAPKRKRVQMASKHVHLSGEKPMGLPAHACPRAGLQRPLLRGCTAVVGCVTCADVPVRMAHRVGFCSVPLSHSNASSQQTSAQPLTLPVQTQLGARLLAERLEGTTRSSFHRHLGFLVRTFEGQMFYSV